MRADTPPAQRPPRSRPGRRLRAAPRRPVATALGLVLLLLVLTAVALLVGRPGGTPGADDDGAAETVACGTWGLEGVEAPVRGPDAPHSGGLFGVDLFGPGEQWRDRFGLEFEHEGIASGYHVLADGVDPERPVGVVYHFHGDGGFEYDHPEYAVSCMAEVARERNMLLVVLQTPDHDDPEVTWWEERGRNAEWFRALVEQRLRADYPLDPERTWFTGYSGGAQFISQELLADHADLLPGGGAVMMGGGQRPNSDPATEPTAAQLEDLRLHWDVGRLDDGSDPAATFDALSAARDGYRWYTRWIGFEDTSLEVRRGIDHFGLPYAGILEDVLDGEL